MISFKVYARRNPNADDMVSITRDGLTQILLGPPTL